MSSSPVSRAVRRRAATRLLVAVVVVSLAAFAGLGPLATPEQAEAQGVGLGNRLFVATGSRGIPGALFVASPTSGA